MSHDPDYNPREQDAVILTNGFFIRYSFGKLPERVQAPPTFAEVMHLHIRLFHYFDFVNSWGRGH